MFYFLVLYFFLPGLGRTFSLGLDCGVGGGQKSLLVEESLGVGRWDGTFLGLAGRMSDIELETLAIYLLMIYLSGPALLCIITHKFFDYTLRAIVITYCYVFSSVHNQIMYAIALHPFGFIASHFFLISFFSLRFSFPLFN